MSAPAQAPALPADVERQLEGLSAEIVIGVPTYNNAATVRPVAEAICGSLAHHFAGVPAVVVNADAGSSDATPDLLEGVGLPLLRVRHEAPLAERASVPFHGIPGRGAALRLLFGLTQRLGARALLMAEADVTSVGDAFVEGLVRPVLERKADLVLPAHARHRYDGTITSLLVAPLVRALFGRRLHQPLAGAAALSPRLLDRLLADPRWPEARQSMTDLWIEGSAIAEGFVVWEMWLDRRRVESRTRPGDLPTLVAQALGAVFGVMDQYEDLWLRVEGSEPVPAVGVPRPASTEPVSLDVDRMVGALRRGLRDLGAIWEQILAPETLGEVLSLEARDAASLRFPDELWARVVYDFALGHHYSVVYREHLLRSLVPLFLGRVAAFVVATRDRDGAAAEAELDAVGAVLERQKPYIVERWR